MDTPQNAIDLIKQFEGWRPKAYRDPVNVLTIGYGHTTAAGAPEVKAGMVISEQQGEDILRNDLRKYAKAITEQVKVPLNPNQFGALVSWCFNVGPGATAKSTLIKKLNRGEYAAVPGELMKWTKAGKKTLPGLVRRRAAEGGLFRTPYVAAKEAPPARVESPPVSPAPEADKSVPEPSQPVRQPDDPGVDLEDIPAANKTAAKTLIGVVVIAIFAAIAALFGGSPS